MSYNETPTLETTMNRIDIVAAVVRGVAAILDLEPKRTPFESVFDEIFCVERYDERIAKQLIEKADNAKQTAVQFNTNRKFKKITKKY